MKSSCTSSFGFTLVELAIALMVIGLLIGGVLKGQELIENARVTSFMKQINDFDTATLIFRNTYGAFPGDIKNPAARVPNCNTAVCNIGGNGNGKIRPDEGSTPYSEIANFFPHMTKAGMLNGPAGGTSEEMAEHLTFVGSGGDIFITSPHYETFFPKMAIGYFHSIIDNAYYILTTTKEMARIDAKMDDGKPVAGSTVRTEECASVEINGEYEYDLTASDYMCGTWIASENWKPWW